MSPRKTYLAGALLASALALPAAAEELRIGTALKFTTLDPHFYYNVANNALSPHIFDPLIALDAHMQPTPRLATSWQAVDDLTWEFRLREGVTWHDGSPFTARDVAFTIERAPNVPNSPASYAQYIRQITGVEVVDDHTIRFRTDTPFPLMPVFLSTFTIVSEAHGRDATTEDYNSGKAAIGTGPYRLVSYLPNAEVVLERNEDYWGGTEPWSKVTFRIIDSGGPRVAALLAGDVDVIDTVPATDLAMLRGRSDLHVVTHPSHQVVFLLMDQHRDDSPFIRAKDGSPLGSNPLQDVRVRKALSMAINRAAIVERILGGTAVPASQTVPPGFLGYTDRLQVQPYDPDGARALLAEAGFPDGFAMTIHGPNDRYQNDAEITEAIGQMLARIGLDMTVETRPGSIHFSEAQRLELSFWMQAAGGFTGEASRLLGTMVITFDAERGLGANNRGRYANSEVDRLFDEAVRTIDDARRGALLARAQEIAIGEDEAVIVLHHPGNVWALRRGLDYLPHYSSDIFAMNVRPATQ